MEKHHQNRCVEFQCFPLYIGNLCLNFFCHLLARKPNLVKKKKKYSSKFFHNFHLSGSSFTCTELRSSGLVEDYRWSLCNIWQTQKFELFLHVWLTNLWISSFSCGVCCFYMTAKRILLWHCCRSFPLSGRDI